MEQSLLNTNIVSSSHGNFFLSASSERKALPIFDGCPSHLNIDLLKELGGYGMIVLIHMTNTSHETNMKDLVSFGIAET